MQFHIRLALVSLVAVQVQEAKSLSQAEATLSLKDTVGSELLTRVDLGSDALGNLGDESTDVDSPEQLQLPGPPMAHDPTSAELALVQAKVSHRDEDEEASQMKKTKTPLSHKKMFEDAFATGQPQQRQRQGARGVALVQFWKKSPEDDAKADAADVAQLGGQLQNIMSELGAPPVDQDSGKKALERASAMEAAANADDADLAIEKEAGDVNKAADAEQDDAEHVVDGAMTYIRTRLANEEHRGLRLRQLLAQSVRANKQMRQKVDYFHKQIAAENDLQKNLRTAAKTKVSQEEAELSKETKRADIATVHLKNATHVAQMGEKAMKFLGNRLQYAKSQVAALLLNLANSTQLSKDLRRELTSTNSTRIKDARLLADSKKVVARQAKELAATKAQILHLEAAKKADDTKLVTLDRQKDMLEQRHKSAVTRDKILHQENNMLKKQLGTEIEGEDKLREMWSKESEAFTWQLRAERHNASESLSNLDKARGEFQGLRTRVQKLRDMASHGEESRRAAEDAANRAQFALTEARAENKQLKGSVPWLEAEVDRQRQTAQNITRQAQLALKERDTVKAILGEAQKNIVQLQGQYADALQALVVAQAGGSADQQQEAPANSIQQFAGLNTDLLGGAPPVSSPLGYPEIPGASESGGSSLLELGRDSRALNSMMNTNQPARVGRVDLNGLLRGMNNVR